MSRLQELRENVITKARAVLFESTAPGVTSILAQPNLEPLRCSLDLLRTAVAEFGLAEELSPLALPQTTPVAEKLSADQAAAWAKLENWVHVDSPYFVLRGFAGTGKTFLMRKLAQLSGLNVFFTAPTNQATKVLSLSVGMPTKTIYSLLGIRMSADEDQMVLDFTGHVPYLPRGSIIVIDEASMLNRELVEFIEQVRERLGLKVLYVGDPAQLNPVGESSSKCWTVTKDKNCRAVLRQVMRYDNHILALSMKIRECIKNRDWVSPLVPKMADGKEIQLLTEARFKSAFLGQGLEHFVDNKVIAWRNKAVDRYTAAIRKDLKFRHEYEVGELVKMASPMQVDGTIVAHVDEDFRIVGRTESKQRVRDNEYIPVYVLSVSGDSNQTLYVPVDPTALDAPLSELAGAARSTSDRRTRAALWSEFWEIKNRFHRLRYAYALTAHRAQGSTFKSVYLDQADILANPTKKEAFRCFYVGATRASTSLISY